MHRQHRFVPLISMNYPSVIIIIIVQNVFVNILMEPIIIIYHKFKYYVLYMRGVDMGISALVLPSNDKDQQHYLGSHAVTP